MVGGIGIAEPALPIDEKIRAMREMEQVPCPMSFSSRRGSTSVRTTWGWRFRCEG